MILLLLLLLPAAARLTLLDYDGFSDGHVWMENISVTATLRRSQRYDDDSI